MVSTHALTLQRPVPVGSNAVESTRLERALRRAARRPLRRLNGPRLRSRVWRRALSHQKKPHKSALMRRCRNRVKAPHHLTPAAVRNTMRPRGFCLAPVLSSCLMSPGVKIVVDGRKARGGESDPLELLDAAWLVS